MRKYIFRIFILIFFFSMIWIKSIYATGVVDKEYEGDRNYGVKCRHQSALTDNSQDDLNYTVKNQGTSSTITISAKSGKNIYVTDSIDLEFVWLDDASSSWVLADQTVFAYYKAPEFKITSGKAKIDPATAAKQSTHNRSGINHTRVKLKFSLEQAGDCIAKGTIEAGTYKYPITIEIKNVQSIGMLCRNTLVDKNHWREVLKTGATPEIMAKRQIEALGVISDKTVINNTKIPFEKKDEYFMSYSYTKFYLGKSETITGKPDGTKTSTSVCKINKGIDNIDESDISQDTSFEWDELSLTTVYTYVMKYCFAYFEDLPADYKMVYVCFGEAAVPREGETEEEAIERVEGKLDEAADEYIEEVIQGIKLGISIAMGAKGIDRDTYDYGRLVDALADRDFYTNSIGNLGEDDVIKVEEKTGKVVEVITSIGMVLAIIIPAILGVKYQIGSVEEKAEYKKSMIPYFVGATLLFSICTVVKIIQAIGTAINQI